MDRLGVEGIRDSNDESVAAEPDWQDPVVLEEARPHAAFQHGPLGQVPGVDEAEREELGEDPCNSAFRNQSEAGQDEIEPLVCLRLRGLGAADRRLVQDTALEQEASQLIGERLAARVKRVAGQVGRA